MFKIVAKPMVSFVREFSDEELVNNKYRIFLFDEELGALNTSSLSSNSFDFEDFFIGGEVNYVFGFVPSSPIKIVGSEDKLVEKEYSCARSFFNEYLNLRKNPINFLAW